MAHWSLLLYEMPMRKKQSSPKTPVCPVHPTAVSPCCILPSQLKKHLFQSPSKPPPAPYYFSSILLKSFWRIHWIHRFLHSSHSNEVHEVHTRYHHKNCTQVPHTSLLKRSRHFLWCNSHNFLMPSQCSHSQSCTPAGQGKFLLCHLGFDTSLLSGSPTIHAFRSQYFLLRCQSVDSHCNRIVPSA